MRKTWIVVLALVFTMSACSSGGSKTTPPANPSTSVSGSPETENPFAGETAWIAYQNDRGGEGTWLIHPDGSDDHQIASDFPGDLILPNWSPDGRRLVMTSRNTGDTEPLYEYDLKTKKLRQLFACNSPCLGDDEPVYSPNGRKVAFIRALGPIRHDVPSDCGFWIGDLSTGEVEQLTSNRGCDRENFLRWSPDGSMLTYWRGREEPVGNTTGTAVFTMNADGSGERQLTDWEMFAGDSDWSPDGKWIVFSTHPLPAFNFVSVVSDLYRVHPDGSGLQQLTHFGSGNLRATQPRYVPNGDWILFTTVTPLSRSLSAIPAEGGKPIVIAQGGGIYTHGTWQPGQ